MSRKKQTEAETERQIVASAWAALNGGQREVCSLDLAKQFGVHPAVVYRALKSNRAFAVARMLFWKRAT